MFIARRLWQRVGASPGAPREARRSLFEIVYQTMGNGRANCCGADGPAIGPLGSGGGGQGTLPRWAWGPSRAFGVSETNRLAPAMRNFVLQSERPGGRAPLNFLRRVVPQVRDAGGLPAPAGHPAAVSAGHGVLRALCDR
jgi:hypothetical protein